MTLKQTIFLLAITTILFSCNNTENKQEENVHVKRTTTDSVQTITQQPKTSDTAGNTATQQSPSINEDTTPKASARKITITTHHTIIDSSITTSAASEKKGWTRFVDKKKVGTAVMQGMIRSGAATGAGEAGNKNKDNNTDPQ